MVMIGAEFGANIVSIQKLAGDTCIFGEDFVRRRQNVDRP